MKKPRAVPVLEINAPLTTETIPPAPQIDTIMIQAKRKWMGGLCIFILFVGAVFFIGFAYFKNNTPSSSPTLVVVAPSKTPVSPPPTISLKIAIWNGSGVAGLAGKVSDMLKNAGYEVVEVKNAPTSQIGTTLLLAQPIKNKEQELRGILKKNNIEISKVEDLMQEEYNVRIVLGN